MFDIQSVNPLQSLTKANQLIEATSETIIKSIATGIVVFAAIGELITEVKKLKHRIQTSDDQQP